MSKTITNVAVFINGQKRMTRVNAEIKPNQVRIFNAKNDNDIAMYDVVETAKQDMAWDIRQDDQIKRLVVQQGCGCSGIKPYTEDESYSGRIDQRGNLINV